MKQDKFRMVAKTFEGLEDVLRDELIDLGAENVEMGNRMVSFEGDLEMMYKANLCCRTALRILKPIVMFNADSTDELYDYLRDLDWEEFMDANTTFSVDSTVYSDGFSHSKFVTYRVKDAIVDHFRDKDGSRPSIRLEGADLQLNVHISGDRVTVSLDSSGEPLYKRGYREAQTEAPINEVLAAGIILKSGWRGDSDFLDPMCGSGTFLIEAALIAANINPGIYRESFAFEKWKDFDKDLFEELYNDDSGEREFNYKIFGGDKDPDAIAVARKNIKGARVEEMVELRCCPLTDWEADTAEGIIVTNPPYGERLRPDNLNMLYKEIGSTLKNNFQGWHAWIIGYHEDQMKEIGLKPSVKIPLNNGKLECTLREYVMFDGAYSQFRAEGGSVASDASEKRKAEGPRKVRHISDDEWRKDSRKFNRDNGMKEKLHGHSKGRADNRQRDERNKSREDYRFRNEGPGDKFKKDNKNHKEFKRKDEDFKRRDEKDFRRKEERRSNISSVSYNPRNSKGPSLPKETEQVINPVHIRKRKGN
ncbi:MAG: RNA methyltransferase [Muribaculaceae bacterium]|nr:RNA methyltransferase [Muribaculaceae bacterium]